MSTRSQERCRAGLMVMPLMSSMASDGMVQAPLIGKQQMSMSCDGTSRAGLMARHWLYRASSGMTRARVMEKQLMSIGQ